MLGTVMNKALTILILILSVFELQGQTDTSLMEITVWDTVVYEKTKNYAVIPDEPVNEELIGVFYSIDFYNFKSQYFTITRDKPSNIKPRTYKLTFKENGECKWKDLTKSYTCGNSIILIDRIRFKKEGELYNIRIQGTRNLSHDFDFNALYRIKMKEGKLVLELASVIKDERISKTLSDNR